MHYDDFKLIATKAKDYEQRETGNGLVVNILPIERQLKWKLQGNY